MHETINAAGNGDVEFLRRCKALNDTSICTVVDDKFCNMFHVAVANNKPKFLREAIKNILPIETTLILLQQVNKDGINPLHVAAIIGNVDVIKEFLDVYKSLQSYPPLDQRPWLCELEDGGTACHFAIEMRNEECACEILKMDIELITNTRDAREVIKKNTRDVKYPLLHLSLKAGFAKLSLLILRSSSSFKLKCIAEDGSSALHYVVHCSSTGSEEDIGRLLLERDPKQIQQITKDGCSVLHYWAMKNELWPFKFLLSIDNIPNVKKTFVDLMSTTLSKNGFNPLHILAENETSSDEDLEIAKLLVENYKQVIATSQISSISRDMFPWLMEDEKGCTPLWHAINRKKEQFAVYILSIDNSALKRFPTALFFAIEKGCHKVAENILNIVNNTGWIEILTNQQQMTVLHLAPLCRDEFLKQVLKSYPELLLTFDEDRNTVFHSWVKMGALSQLKYFLSTIDLYGDKKRAILMFMYLANKERYNPLHYAAMSTHETSYQIVELLIDHYKENPDWRDLELGQLPWVEKDVSLKGPLHLAMDNQREKLALFFLSQHQESITKLLDYYEPDHKTLFLAVKKNCYQVAKKILTNLEKESWSKYVVNDTDGQTILHLAPYCKDIEFARWLVQEASNFITQKNSGGDSPLDVASDIGAVWIIQTMLEKDPSVFAKVPLAWVKACKKGHTSVVRVFIDYYPGKFSYHCIDHQDSPLHHIKLRNSIAYEEFLKIPSMKDLVNVQDSQGRTPLHKAIIEDNIFLTETLLNMENIRYDIKDHNNMTVTDVLCKKYKEKYEWKQMCESIGLDPTIKTSYFQHKANLLDARNTLALVAALLATITFTAGFTLPGGFDQNTGEALLAKKAIFLVFLLSDTLAMCCSMLILIFLVWSMVYNGSNSLVLINHSMKLLLISLYFTLLAFMTGVYIVISPKSLWAAILVLVMCTSIGFFANLNWVYKVRDKLLCRAIKEGSHKELTQQLLEKGMNDNPLLEHPEGSSQLNPVEISQQVELREITTIS